MTHPNKETTVEERFTKAFRRGDGAWQPNFEKVVAFWVAELQAHTDRVVEQLEKSKKEEISIAHNIEIDILGLSNGSFNNAIDTAIHIVKNIK